MELKQRIQKQKGKGLFIKVFAHPSLVVMAKDAGMDFVFYDCEHGILSYEQLHDLMLLANITGLSSLVRVAQLSRSDISRILDHGASGVMVPMMENAQQARQLVEWSKYPPIGKRSYSGGANTLYGPSGNHEKHMKELNDKTMSIVQIETRAGVEHIDEILDVEGIDGAIIGPCDLAISLGHPDDIMRKEELDMIDRIADACQKRHLAFGIIGNMQLQEYGKKKANLLISAIDTSLMREGLCRVIQDYIQLERNG